jgi:hypothetical protein
VMQRYSNPVIIYIIYNHQRCMDSALAVIRSALTDGKLPLIIVQLPLIIVQLPLIIVQLPLIIVQPYNRDAGGG